MKHESVYFRRKKHAMKYLTETMEFHIFEELHENWSEVLLMKENIQDTGLLDFPDKTQEVKDNGLSKYLVFDEEYETELDPRFKGNLDVLTQLADCILVNQNKEKLFNYEINKI